MNLTVLKSSAFWISAVTTVIALLISSGAILSGSAVDHVVAYVIAILGALTGHSVANPAPAATPPSA